MEFRLTSVPESSHCPAEKMRLLLMAQFKSRRSFPLRASVYPSARNANRTALAFSQYTFGPAWPRVKSVLEFKSRSRLENTPLSFAVS